jgi:hypothetical protein
MNELLILENFIYNMPDKYRTYNRNYQIVGDILLRGTSTSGMTSCCEKCIELGIDPYSYSIYDKA